MKLALRLLAVTALLVSPPVSAKDLATVDGQGISPELLKKAADGMGQRGEGVLANPMLRRQLLDHMIDSRLAAKAATGVGLEHAKEYQELLDEAKTQILANLYLRQYIDAHTKEADVKALFAKDPSRFSSKEIRCSHILVATETEARQILDEAQKPTADFEALAKLHSKGPSGPTGGDLGYFQRGRMVPEFEQAAFSLGKGQIFPRPVKTVFGYHVIKVLDVRGTDDVTFDKVKDRVKETLELDVHDQLVQALRAKAKVAVDEDALKNYR